MTEFEKNTNIDIDPEILLTDDDSDEAEVQAFYARMEAAYKGLESKKDKLTSLYENGEHEALNDEIDDIVDTIAGDSPEVQENLRRLRELRGYRNPGQVITDEIKEITARQKDLFADYRTLVINEAGLPDEARFSEIETARNTIAEMLNSEFKGTPYNSDQALAVLGIKTVGDDNKESFTFPDTLVPASTTGLWTTYLASVCNHVRSVEDLKDGKTDKASVEQVDRTRTFSHNAVTKELHTILNLQPTDAWEFINTRQLIASIRDQVLPTKEAALSEDSLALLENHRANLSISSQLASH